MKDPLAHLTILPAFSIITTYKLLQMVAQLISHLPTAPRDTGSKPSGGKNL